MNSSVWRSCLLGLSLVLHPLFSSAEDISPAGGGASGIESEGAESVEIPKGKQDFEFSDNKFQSFRNWLDRVIPGHLELGTRSTGFKILDDKKDSFVGSINFLDSAQNYDPTRVFLDWIFWSGEKFELGTEITWDRIAARTITSSSGQNDGTLLASGPIWTLIGRYHNDSRFTPYAGVGAAFYNRTNVDKGWWHYGFSGATWQEAESKYLAWRQSGAPSWPNNGYNRTFTLDGATGFVATLGCSVTLGGNWSADLYGRYTNIVIDNNYTLAYYEDVIDSRQNEFDLTNVAGGIGIKYAFG